LDLNVYRVHYNKSRDVIQAVHVHGELEWKWVAVEAGNVAPCFHSHASFFTASRVVKTQLSRRFVSPRIAMKDMNGQVKRP